MFSKSYRTRRYVQSNISLISGKGVYSVLPAAMQLIFNIRISMAAVLSFYDGDTRIECMNNLINVLFEPALTPYQTSCSAQFEKLIYDTHGALHLSQMLIQVQQMFVESLTFFVGASSLKCKQFQSEDGQQRLPTANSSCDNVPASNCHSEGAVNSFKHRPSNVPQLHHPNREGLTVFGRNATYNWYVNTCNDDHDTYSSAIRILFNQTQRAFATQRRICLGDINSKSYDNQLHKAAKDQAKNSRIKARNSKILENVEICSLIELDDTLFGLTSNKQRQILTTQLKIHKIKYKCHIPKFSKNTIKTSNDILKKALEKFIITRNEIDKAPPSKSNDDAVYFVCRQKYDDTQRDMLQCGACEEWFHQKCIKMTDAQFQYYSNHPWNCSTSGLKCSRDNTDRSPNSNKDINLNRVSKLECFAPFNLHICSDDMLSSNEWPDESINIVGGGLINLGNSCFMNASLQCLSFVPMLQQYCTQVDTSRCQHHHPFDLCALESISGLVPKLTSLGVREFYRPATLFHNLPSIRAGLRGGRQEDAHEFIGGLMEQIQNCDVNKHKYNQQSDGLQNTTAIHKIFGGYLVSIVIIVKTNYNTNA